MPEDDDDLFHVWQTMILWLESQQPFYSHRVSEKKHPLILLAIS